jgi:hypothetical protein
MSIEVYAGQITTELLESKINLIDGNAPICLKCKTANVQFYAKVVKCANQNCGLTIFRTKSEKELTDKQITESLTKGHVSYCVFLFHTKKLFFVRVQTYKLFLKFKIILKKYFLIL